MRFLMWYWVILIYGTFALERSVLPMSKQLITVGHSPDPDDAFMFYALAHDKLDTGDLQFRHV